MDGDDDHANDSGFEKIFEVNIIIILVFFWIKTIKITFYTVLNIYNAFIPL